MKKSGTALVSVCSPKSVKHLQTIDLEIVVSYGAKSFLCHLNSAEAIDLATRIMIEVCKRNDV